MGGKQPLERRITLAFVLMTLIVSGTFSLGIVAIVHFIEEHLVSEELGRELDFAIDEELRHGEAARIDASTRFFSSHAGRDALPPRFAGLPEGFSEVIDGDEAYYVFKRSHDRHEDVLVKEQHEFEARERALFDVVLAGFLLSVFGAWGLGRLLAHRVMTPLRRLAQQVRHRDQLLPMAPRLAPDYPDDEVGWLAAAFDETLGQLRHSLERERLFTSDVSHELRTPLMVIATSCELLLGSPGLSGSERAQLDRIARASADMHDLVQTFLRLARAGQENEGLADSVSLNKLAAEQYRQWAPHFQAKGLAFALIDEGSSLGRYEAPQLRTVMSNLLRNALHYTDQGAVRLILGTDGFRVEDSGQGVPEEEQERIFHSFVRGHRTRGEGLGLGLSLVRRICQQQGWAVRVESIPDSGSCFSVDLGKGR
ncbi:sensor histidine kinase [Metapseudomonas furukawaii]|uniref:histidine kinase n=1 Tax=Metapseudomonas furukawaii TaxID=1149133 RepID=A0AAD1BZQ0_METFU|nr:HAMP domain-containing sensor histidine kinase [Pseudomonas furukawaii]ELS26492.1 two-component system sensor protein [Pseudomonas furukawaii]BAU74258.1 two-component system sensor protein [Pseudomonas furukawaii]